MYSISDRGEETFMDRFVRAARALVRLKRLLSDAKARAGWAPAVP